MPNYPRHLLKLFFVSIFCIFHYEQVRGVCHLNFSGKIYQLEMATSQSERHKGLMNRFFLSPNKGMLFVFPYTSFHSFWMYNTFIPLDILWIDNKSRLVDVQTSASPLNIRSLVPSKKARYVIELPSNSAHWPLHIGRILDIKCHSPLHFR